MSLKLEEIKSGGNKDFGRLEDGNYPARIVSVVDLGLQAQVDWTTGDPTKDKERVLITWEFPTERIELENDEGTQSLPRWQCKEYTLSLHEMAALSKLIGVVAPDITELSELVNVPCAVQIGTTSGGNAKVTGVSKPMKGFNTPPLENETAFFDFSDPDETLFNSIPLWQRRKITQAENYEGFADGWDLGEDDKKGDY